MVSFKTILIAEFRWAFCNHSQESQHPRKAARWTWQFESSIQTCWYTNWHFFLPSRLILIWFTLDHCQLELTEFLLKADVILNPPQKGRQLNWTWFRDKGALWLIPLSEHCFMHYHRHLHHLDIVTMKGFIISDVTPIKVNYLATHCWKWLYNAWNILLMGTNN